MATRQELKNKISSIIDSMEDEIISFIQKVVQTSSLPGEEKDAQDIIASKLSELNLEVDVIPLRLDEIKEHPAFCDDGFPFNKRVNVVGRWMGTKDSSITVDENVYSLILNGHIDVVPPGNEELWDESPWSGKIKDGKLYGRGAADMKAGLSTAIFAIKALQKLGFKPLRDVLMESVAGEETGGCGTLTTIIKGYCADAAIIMEPTQLKICPVQSGALSFKIKVFGRSIHACMKNKGISAIEKFYIIFNAINELEKQRHLNYKNSLYEDPMNIAPISFGTINGGSWYSTVPDELLVKGRYGIFPGESIEDGKRVLEQTVKLAAAKDDWLKSNPPIVEWVDGQFEPGRTDMNEPIIKTLSNCHMIVLGEQPKLEGVTYGSDLRLFTNYANIPTVLYGPGNVVNAHTVDEFISIDEVITATKILALIIYKWCGGGVRL